MAVLPQKGRGCCGKGWVIFRGRGPPGRAGASRQSAAPSRCPERKKKKKKGLLSQIKACLAKVMAILQLEPEIFTWQWDSLEHGVPI